LADDHALLLDAFERLLAPTCDVVGKVSDGRAVIDAVQMLNPTIVVLDIAMPLLNGLDAARMLRDSSANVHVIFLTMNDDPDLMTEALRLGAAAYLLKRSAASELLAAISAVSEGRSYITPLLEPSSPARQEEAPAPTQPLTSRQREVLQLVAEGYSMKQMADVMKLTPRTIAFHKYRMMRQLRIKSTAELVKYAVKHAIV